MRPARDRTYNASAAQTRLKAVNEASALKTSYKTFTFTFEAFDGDPSDPATTCLSVGRAQLSSKRAGHPCVSVAGYFPPSVERDRIAFLRVLVSRRETGEVAVLYSGAATGEEISGGSARWFECYWPPWIELDDDPNATDDDDDVPTGNVTTALVWKLAPGKESHAACCAYFMKRVYQGGETYNVRYMPLNEVLFRLEHLLVFD